MYLCPRLVAILAVLTLPGAGWSAPRYQREVLPFERDFLAKPDDVLAVGARFQALLQTGKTVSDLEVVGLKPGKTRGTLRAVTCKSEKANKRQDLQFDAVIRIQVLGRNYPVLYDAAAKAYVLLDVSGRDDIVEQRLRAKGRALWKEPTGTEQAEFLEQQKAHAESVGSLFPAKKFVLHETKFYLIYSDLPEATITAFGKGLDGMYQQIGPMFGVHPEQNIWAGKCLMLVFIDRDAQLTYFERLRNIPAGGIYAARRFTEPDGRLIITYNPMNATALINGVTQDTVTGFLSRFRSNVAYPRWMEEGLCRMFADNLINTRGNEAPTINYLRTNGKLDGLLTGKKTLIDGYDVATSSMVMKHLYNKDPLRFRGLVTMLKEGAEPDEAVKESYGLTLEELGQDFGKAIGIPNLQP